MKRSSTMPFRQWLQEKWFEHREELDSINQKCNYDVEHYFNKYKYWLKREYKHQTRKS